MNLNIKLDTNSVKYAIKKLGRSIGPITILIAGGFIIYTGHFISNLLFSNGDTTALEKKQTDSDTAQQIRFNEKTLQSLDTLMPARNTPQTKGVGKEDPFAPN